MDMLNKLHLACQGCDQEVIGDSEIPVLVRHPDQTITTSVIPPLDIPRHKLKDMEVFHA